MIPADLKEGKCALDVCEQPAMWDHPFCYSCRFILDDKMSAGLYGAFRYKERVGRFPPDYQARLREARRYLKKQPFYKELQVAAKQKTG